MSAMTARPETVTHRVPGTELEVSIRPFYLGPKFGWHYGVALYRIGGGKASWRQVGSEFTFDNPDDARERANALWAANRKDS